MKKFSSFLHHLTLLLIMGTLSAFTGLSGYAQSPSEAERVLFIQISDLSPDDFFKIQGAFKDNPEVFVKQACIPAEVIMFGLGSSNNLSLDENFNRVKGVVLERTNLSQVAILAEYSEADFLERCKLFRMGGSDAQ